MKSTIVAFGIAAAAALFLVIISAVGLRLGCGSTVSVPSRMSTPLRVDLPADIEIAPAILQFVQAAPDRAPAVSWSRQFFCSVNVTDLSLIAFAIFLVMIAILQGQWLKRSVETSEMSTRIFHAAMVATQRAYVVLREFQVHVTRPSSIEDVQSCTVQPIWENAGTTPTRNGRSYVNWRYFDRAVPDDFDFADYDDNGERLSGSDRYLPMTIGPRGLSFSPAIVMDGSTVRMVRELQGRVLIWGWAEYDDVFENSSRHRTEFCYQMSVAGSATASHISFSQYERFNGVDEDCERQPSALPDTAF
jgi:hypothetical protein